VNQINPVSFDISCVLPAFDMDSGRMKLESMAKTGLEYWRLEFGYCLFFVIWCLEFIKFKDSARLKYTV
jgi:hypothetical protein